jgi:hypothetical protein
MSRTVIHDPKDAASRFIRLLPHDFAHKPIDGSNSTFDFTAAEGSCSMDIPSCQVGPGPQAEVLMLDASGSVGGIIQLAKRRARGFRNFLYLRTIAYWVAGQLKANLPSYLPT